MNHLLMVFTLFSIGALGFVTYAQAEELTNSTATNSTLTVQVQKYSEGVEVQITHPISDWFCKVQHEGYVPTTVCFFEGITEDGNEKVWDFVDEKWTTTEILEAEAKANYQDFLANQTKVVPEPTEWQNNLEQLGDKEGATADELRNLLNKQIGAQCFRGILVDGTAGFQTFGAWDIPTEEWLNPDTGDWEVRIAKSYDIESLDFKGLLGKVSRMVEDCVAQNTLAASVSPAIVHKANEDVKDQIHHSEIAKDVPTYSQDWINQDANKHIQTPMREANDPVCTGNYGQSLKDSYGCPSVELELGQQPPNLEDYMKTNEILVKVLEDNQEEQLRDVTKKNLAKYLERHK